MPPPPAAGSQWFPLPHSLLLLSSAPYAASTASAASSSTLQQHMHATCLPLSSLLTAGLPALQQAYSSSSPHRRGLSLDLSALSLSTATGGLRHTSHSAGAGAGAGSRRRASKPPPAGTAGAQWCYHTHPTLPAATGDVLQHLPTFAACAAASEAASARDCGHALALLAALPPAERRAPTSTQQLLRALCAPPATSPSRRRQRAAASEASSQHTARLAASLVGSVSGGETAGEEGVWGAAMGPYREAGGGGAGSFAPLASYTARVGMGTLQLPLAVPRGIGTLRSPRRDGTGRASPTHTLPTSPRNTLWGNDPVQQWRGVRKEVSRGEGEGQGGAPAATQRVAHMVASAGRYVPGPGGAGGSLPPQLAAQLQRSQSQSRASGRGILETLRGAAGLRRTVEGARGGGSGSGSGFEAMGRQPRGAEGRPASVLAAHLFPHPDAASTEDLASFFKQQRWFSRGQREERLGR